MRICAEETGLSGEVCHLRNARLPAGKTAVLLIPSDSGVQIQVAARNFLERSGRDCEEAITEECICGVYFIGKGVTIRVMTGCSTYPSPLVIATRPSSDELANLVLLVSILSCSMINGC